MPLSTPSLWLAASLHSKILFRDYRDRINCGYGRVYVGQTERIVHERFLERKKDFNKLLKYPASHPPPDSLPAVAHHCHIEDHSFQLVTLTPVQYCSNGKQMNRLEDFYPTLETLTIK